MYASIESGAERRARNYAFGLHRSVVAAGLVCAIGATFPARAETLIDALRDAFQQSPVLGAERERLRATDQSIPAARTGFLPTVTAGAVAGLQQNQYADTPGLTARQKPIGWNITFQQPIFDGGAALAAVRRATASVRAGRQSVASVESDVLLAAATVYADVIQARAILALQLESVRALESIHAMTRERQSVGDLSISDLAQSESAVAGASIQIGAARAAVATAEGQFLQVVRRPPGQLDAFTLSTIAIPDKLESALHSGEMRHPAILAALQRETAARHDIDVANAKYLPTVALEASYQSRRDYDGLQPPTDPRASASLQAVARIPIYSGGSVDAEVEAARHIRLSLLHELTQQRALVRTAVIQAWSGWQQANGARRLLGQQIAANTRALAGLRKEHSVGQRTLIDVLNAERDLSAARVALEQSNRNAMVAVFVLLASVGGLTPHLLERVAGDGRHHLVQPKSAKVDTPNTPRTAWSTTVHAATVTRVLH